MEKKGSVYKREEGTNSKDRGQSFSGLGLAELMTM
jgi:hypothetical protein